jgi:hypothetical protein
MSPTTPPRARRVAALAACAIALAACADGAPTSPDGLAPSRLVRPRPTPNGQDTVPPVPGDRAPTFQQLEICKYGSTATLHVQQQQPAPRGFSQNTFDLLDGECWVVADHRTDEDMTYTVTETASPAGYQLDSIRVTDLGGNVSLITSGATWTHTKPMGEGNGWLVEFFNSKTPPPPPPPKNCTNTTFFWWAHSGDTKHGDETAALLPIPIGTPGGYKSFVVTTPEQAHDVLSLTYNGGSHLNGISKLMATLLAAKLNVARGASAYAIQHAMNEADQILAATSPAHWHKMSFGEKFKVTILIAKLELYNIGLIGPGNCYKPHCK